MLLLHCIIFCIVKKLHYLLHCYYCSMIYITWEGPIKSSRSVSCRTPLKGDNAAAILRRSFPPFLPHSRKAKSGLDTLLQKCCESKMPFCCKATGQRGRGNEESSVQPILQATSGRLCVGQELLGMGAGDCGGGGGEEMPPPHLCMHTMHRVEKKEHSFCNMQKYAVCN